MHILLVTDRLPYPPISGDRIRIFNLMRQIQSHHEVWLASLADSREEVDEAGPLRQYCAGMVTVVRRRRHPLAHLPGLIQYALAGKPLELKFSHSSALAEEIRSLAAGCGIDLVDIQHSHMAPYGELFDPASRKRVLTLHNIAFDQYQKMSHLQQGFVDGLRDRLFSASMRRWEPRIAQQFDRCVTVSEADRSRLLAMNPRLQISVVPNGVDTHRCRPILPIPTQPSLLFVGTLSYAPCADAADYFCREVLPLIQAARGEAGPAQVWIVGADPPQSLRRYTSEAVHVTGWVPDVAPYYAFNRVCIVPLRAGGGTRLKILEAMAYGRPVVTTSVGCEGLEVQDGEHLLVADDPRTFAEKTIRLLEDPALCEFIVRRARLLVERKYDWSSIAAQLLRVYAAVGEGRPEPLPVGSYSEERGGLR